MLQHTDRIYVKKVRGKGRGVFASDLIRKRTVIERVPLMLVPVEMIVDGYANPRVDRLFFEYDKRRLAICLGYGLLYNHSYEPNACYKDGPGLTIIFRALRNIEPNEEICINYNGNPGDFSPMGFKVLD